MLRSRSSVPRQVLSLDRFKRNFPPPPIQVHINSRSSTEEGRQLKKCLSTQDREEKKRKKKNADHRVSLQPYVRAWQQNKRFKEKTWMLQLRWFVSAECKWTPDAKAMCRTCCVCVSWLRRRMISLKTYSLSCVKEGLMLNACAVFGFSGLLACSQGAP